MIQRQDTFRPNALNPLPPQSDIKLGDPRSVSDMEQARSSIEFQLQRLDEAWAKLLRKLEPVIVPTPTPANGEQEEAAKPSVSSPLASDLRAVAYRIGSMAGYIDNLTGVIDL